MAHPWARGERRAARHQLQHPQRTDTEAIGALLYAALTQRWPYENDAYGLSGLPKGVGLIAPDQVRVGVHRGLSELAMRALANDGATASRHESPCTTPEELVKAIAEMPRIRPPEPAFTAPPEYQRTSYQQGSYGRPVPHAAQPVPTPAPAAEPHRQGPQVDGVGAPHRRPGPRQLAARGRADGPQQVRRHPADAHDGRQRQGSHPSGTGRALKVKAAREYIASGEAQAPQDVDNTFDGDSSTYWRTKRYVMRPCSRAVQARCGDRLRPRFTPRTLGSFHRAPIQRRPHHDSPLCGRLVEPHDGSHGNGRIGRIHH